MVTILQLNICMWVPTTHHPATLIIMHSTIPECKLPHLQLIKSVLNTSQESAKETKSKYFITKHLCVAAIKLAR